MEKKELLPVLDSSIKEIRRISGGSSDVLINRFGAMGNVERGVGVGA